MTLAELEARLREGLALVAGVRFAFLFGSGAARGPEEARDIDVAVAFARAPGLMELAALASDLERLVGKTVDVIDLDEASTLLRWEVLRTGRLLVAPDEAVWLAFAARVPLEYADLRPYLDREAAGLRRALGVP